MTVSAFSRGEKRATQLVTFWVSAGAAALFCSAAALDFEGAATAFAGSPSKAIDRALGLRPQARKTLHAPAVRKRSPKLVQRTARGTKEESFANARSDEVADDPAEAAIEEPARGRRKRRKERGYGDNSGHPIEGPKPGPKRHVPAGNAEAKRGKRQDEKGRGQAKALHERIGDARTPASQPVMRLRQRRVAGARVPVGPADQSKPTGDCDANKRRAEQPPRQTPQFDCQRLRQKPCRPRLHPRTPPHS